MGVLNMKKTIITIGREFGSGGREIGQKLSEALGIEFYDKELLEHTAKDSGLCEEILKHHDEKRTASFLYSLVLDPYNAGYAGSPYADMPIDQKVFLAQYDTIKKLAEKGSGIFVGRCADYVLSDNPNVLSVFIHADNDFKVKRIMERYELSERKAEDLISRKNKQRSTFYNYYTSKKWGNAKSYDLCIDSSIFGIDGTVELIKNAMEV